jgi:predicted phosphohydrolase
MMKSIAWATDVHLNAVEQSEVKRFCDDVKACGATSLLLGGDIAEAMDLVQWLKSLETGLRMPIYFVLGNHDYYGSDVRAVRTKVHELQSPNLKWLPDVGCVPLSSDVCLVGHGGWGDARIGDLDRFALLTDYLAIEDLFETLDRDDFLAGFRKRRQLRHKLASLGDGAANALRPTLLEAVRKFPQVVVLTHVPPFREACWHGGRISDEEWLPGFTCKAIGDLLLEAAESHSGCSVTVLCGHTHGTGYVRIRPNLDVYTAEATYGKIYFRVIELDGVRVKMKIT